MNTTYIYKISLLFSFMFPIFELRAALCFDKLVHAYRFYRPGIDSLNLENAVKISVPTQYLLGAPRIEVLREKLLSVNFHELKRIIEKKPIPYILGPNNQRYIIDRHHTLYAFNMLIPEFKTKGILVDKLSFEFRQVDDLSHLSHHDFLQKMDDRKWLYPYNKQGVKDLYNIPTNISLLEFDFYRGLAWIIRKSGAIKKNDQSVPFLEFYWAKAFKELLSFENETLTEGKIYKAISLALSRSKSVSHLPGYRQIPSPYFTIESCFKQILPILDILRKKGILTE